MTADRIVPGQSPTREHWQKVYGHKAEHEVSWFQSRPATSLDLIETTGAGRGARIVDVGGPPPRDRARNR